MRNVHLSKAHVSETHSINCYSIKPKVYTITMHSVDFLASHFILSSEDLNNAFKALRFITINFSEWRRETQKCAWVFYACFNTYLKRLMKHFTFPSDSSLSIINLAAPPVHCKNWAPASCLQLWPFVRTSRQCVLLYEWPFSPPLVCSCVRAQAQITPGDLCCANGFTMLF